MSLITNFFPIELPFESFQISRVPFTKERLTELRDQHNKTHSFFRATDYIYISPMVGEPLAIGELTTLDIQDNAGIVSSLIKHIFFRAFREKYQNIVPLDFYPFRILSRKKEDDLILELLPQNLKGILSLKKLIEVQFRNIQIGGRIQFGAVINVRYRWLFDKNCKELLDEGYNIQGLQVLISEPIPGLEGILAPDESLIGAIVSVNGDEAIIETNEGEETYNLQELFLHKSTRNIRGYLEFRVGEAKANHIVGRIRQEDQTQLNAKYYFKEVKQMAKTIASLDYLNKDGFCFSISEMAQPITTKFDIHDPNFIFDYNPGATHNNPSVGLVNFGPYDSSTFDTKHPIILVVCHKSNRGGFAEFVGKLKSGIPTSANFKGGMKGKYRLHDISFEIVELDDYSIAAYQTKITNYIKSHDSLPHLAIVETTDWFKHQPPEDNPYYRAKAYFLGLGIPVQFVKNENIRKVDNDLQWIIESVALQMYAKLGGKAWVLPASSSIDYEIIVGIGSSMLRPNLLVGNLQERIVGITTFFTGDGRYIFGNRCKEVPFDEYFDELLSNLRQSVKDISEEYGWQDNATIRITFHIFKPIKNVEADVVEQLLTEFAQYNIQYCFVTVVDSHPFLMFDTNQSGIGKNNKGEYVPERGVNWILDDYACLLQLKGPKDIKTAKHKFSNPVLVRIHEKSTYKDLNTVTQQIFNFTNLSWRGFHPAQQPVTILYSDLIAHQLSNLRRIKTWKPEIINSVLKYKKWFL